MCNNVYWITGLSGAGKTTVGRALYARLAPQNKNLVLLDGDSLRQVLGDRFGYSHEDRLTLALTYARLCRMLADQGMIVICCTISMFDQVREWNRANIEGYIEVYLEVPEAVLLERNQKELYSGALGGEQANVVGVTMSFEAPKSPDLIVKNDGNLSVQEIVEQIMFRGEYKEACAQHDTGILGFF